MHEKRSNLFTTVTSDWKRMPRAENLNKAATNSVWTFKTQLVYVSLSHMSQTKADFWNEHSATAIARRNCAICKTSERLSNWSNCIKLWIALDSCMWLCVLKMMKIWKLMKEGKKINQELHQFSQEDLSSQRRNFTKLCEIMIEYRDSINCQSEGQRWYHMISKEPFVADLLGNECGKLSETLKSFQILQDQQECRTRRKTVLAMHQGNLARLDISPTTAYLHAICDRVSANWKVILPVSHSHISRQKHKRQKAISPVAFFAAKTVMRKILHRCRRRRNNLRKEEVRAGKWKCRSHPTTKRWRRQFFLHR